MAPTESDVSTSSSEAAGSSSGTSSGSDKESPPPPGKKVKSAEPHEKPPSKKRPCSSGQVTNGAVASRPGTSKLSKPELDDAEKDKSLEMAEKRKVYQSLFSSNTAERPKELTSNWVTFYPYH